MSDLMLVLCCRTNSLQLAACQH